MKTFKFLKKGIVFLLSVIVISTAFFVVPASAATNKEKRMPTNVRVSWYKLNTLNDVIKEDTKLTLKLTVKNASYPLYVSFPKEGGFRLYGDESGYYSPQAVNKITYTEKDGVLTAKSSGSTSIKLQRKSGNWAIDIYDGNQLVGRFTGSQLAVGYDRDNKLAKARIEGSIGKDEIFTGLGERFDGIVRNGKSSLLWNLDVYNENADPSPDADKSMSYLNVPLLHSSYGYSMFFNSSYAINADIGKTNSKKYTMEAYGPIMDFYYWTGEPQERLNGYLALTGNTVIPPKWAFSYWAGNSAQVWKGQEISLLNSVFENYNRLGTPIVALYGEGTPEKDSKSYNVLKKNNTRMLGWHDNSFWDISSIESLFPGVEDLPAVKSYLNPKVGYSNINYIDYSHPLAKEATYQLLKQRLDWGMQGAMIDIADGLPEDTLFRNGKTGAEMHNLLTIDYLNAFRDIFEEKWGNDYILFARPGYAGTQSIMCNFLGDHPTTYAGLKSSLSGGLTLSQSGYSVWGSDIGGLGGTTTTPTSDLYRRWLQWSVFNPLMRAHGHTERNPWNFGEGAERDFQKYYWLRENIVNTLYSSAIHSNKTGETMTQTLAHVFPEQSQLYKIEDEYLFCNDILVAPITEEIVSYRKTTLPNGNWTDFWTGKNIAGGQTVTSMAIETTIPLYIRSGAVLPVQLSKTLEFTDTMLNEDRVEALLVTPAISKRNVCYYTDENTKVSFVTNMPKDGVTTITTSDKCNAKVIVAKGIAASKITVDGKTLRKVKTVTSDGVPGFAVDNVNNTTTIKLPVGNWKEISITSGGGVAKDLALNAKTTGGKDTNTNSSSYATDGKPETVWQISSASDTHIQVDFEKEKKFNTVNLLWGYNYANGYKIETSSDGENWNTVYETTEGVGDQDYILLDKTYSARYVRIGDFKKAQNTPAVLCELNIYYDQFIAAKFEGLDVDDTDDTDDSYLDYVGENDAATENNTFEENEGEGEEEDDSWIKKIIRRRRKNGGFQLWLLILIIVVVILILTGIIIAIIILIKRKKKAAKAEGINI